MNRSVENESAPFVFRFPSYTAYKEQNPGASEMGYIGAIGIAFHEALLEFTRAVC